MLLQCQGLIEIEDVDVDFAEFSSQPLAEFAEAVVFARRERDDVDAVLADLMKAVDVATQHVQAIVGAGDGYGQFFGVAQAPT